MKTTGGFAMGIGRTEGTISAIKSLGYSGGSCLTVCECEELPCPLLSWLSAELKARCPELQGTNGSGDVLLVEELRHLLSDLFFPLTLKTSDLLEPSSLINITEFLVSELMAACIIKQKELHPEENLTENELVKKQRLEDCTCEGSKFCQEDEDASDANRRISETQAEWILLLRALDLDSSSQFEDVQCEVKARLARLPGSEMMDPLLDTSLSSDQWTQLKKIDKILSDDYRRRKEMMVKRFQVTIESFSWGEKQKERSKVLASMPSLESFTGSSQVSLCLLLAARKDQSFIQPIKAGKSTPIYKMLMGSVPDRGGRPGEIEPPMPTWEDRRAQRPSGGRGGGHKHREKKRKGKRD